MGDKVLKRVILIGIILVTAAVAIGIKIGSDNSKVYVESFCAVITQKNEDWLLVKGIVENDINHRGDFELSVDKKTYIVNVKEEPIKMADLKEGSLIQVYYYGGVLETDPAQIEHVEQITCLE